MVKSLNSLDLPLPVNYDGTHLIFRLDIYNERTSILALIWGAVRNNHDIIWVALTDIGHTIYYMLQRHSSRK